MGLQMPCTSFSILLRLLTSKEKIQTKKKLKCSLDLQYQTQTTLSILFIKILILHEASFTLSKWVPALATQVQILKLWHKMFEIACSVTRLRTCPTFEIILKVDAITNVLLDKLLRIANVCHGICQECQCRVNQPSKPSTRQWNVTTSLGGGGSNLSFVAAFYCSHLAIHMQQKENFAKHKYQPI